MLISNAAIFDLECRFAAAGGAAPSRFRRLCERLWGPAEYPDPARPAPAEAIPAGRPQLRLVPSQAPTSMLRLVDASDLEPENTLNPNLPQSCERTHSLSPSTSADENRGGLFRWRRHPQLRTERAADGLSDSERTARLAAMRGVFAARDGELDIATELFLEAVREPTVDLGEVPGFWQLSRAGMNAAISAYEAAGRIRDASAMTARIRTVFRPRPVTQPRQRPIHVPDRKASTGG